MKFMVLVKATKDSEAGVMPSHELLAAMGKFNKAPERIVYSGGPECGHPCGGGLPPRALVTITFAEHDGKTTLTIDTRFESAVDRDAAVKTGFNMGWASSLDRLADLLEKL